MKLKFKKLHSEAKLPVQAKPGDAGLDLVATTMMTVYKERLSSDGESPLPSAEVLYVEYGLGIAAEIPHGHVGLLFPRSSVTNKDLMMKNCVGVVDSGYRGEIKARFNYLGDESKPWMKPNIYGIGERVAQLVIIAIPEYTTEFVDELSDTERGKGGYGSTGNK